MPLKPLQDPTLAARQWGREWADNLLYTGLVGAG